MQLDLNYQSRYDCDICPTRCDGRSKTTYIFEDDVALSEKAENWLLNHLQAVLGLTVRKAPAQAHGLPDLEIIRDNQVVGRVEVKAQGRAFMSVARLLPQGNLRPYETLALNLSDLERYIALHKIEQKPIYIVWRVKRPCIGEGYWGQSIETFSAIYAKYGVRRRYRRASTESDIVNGEHKGVTVNYHFSLRELLPLEEVERLLSTL
jgi:GR25 family glycosyltransferase involved in LPS biosynthesis